MKSTDDVVLATRIKNMRGAEDHWKAEVHIYSLVFDVDTRFGVWGYEEGDDYKHVRGDIAALLQDERKKVERRERRQCDGA